MWVERTGLAKTVDPAGGTFVNLGRVSRIRFSPQVELKDVIAPNPGQQVRIDSIPVQKLLDFSATIKEVSPLSWRLAFQSALALNASGSTNYNPGAGNGVLKAWVKIQQYDHDGTLYNHVDLYAALMIDGDLDLDASEIDTTIRGRVIESAYNAGTFANLV